MSTRLFNPVSSLQTDNCTREGKNQTIMKMSGSAVINQKPLGTTRGIFCNIFSNLRACRILRFRSVTHIFGEVGHTHGPLDQRLAVAVSAFTDADTIQTPEAGGGSCLKGLQNWFYQET